MVYGIDWTYVQNTKVHSPIVITNIIVEKGGDNKKTVKGLKRAHSPVRKHRKTGRNVHASVITAMVNEESGAVAPVVLYTHNHSGD